MASIPELDLTSMHAPSEKRVTGTRRLQREGLTLLHTLIGEQGSTNASFLPNIATFIKLSISSKIIRLCP
jgi:hypothetical protein